ncbi:hypothetical protein JL722_11384 [Aureococcus anophagefferens]|nr:hypothetical protein JL722_11384 [Aureococcus anophagefferens]
MGGPYAPIGARRSRRRLPLAALGLAAVAGVAGLAYYRRGGAAPPALAAAAAAASSEPSITVRNDHGAWRSTTAYPWSASRDGAANAARPAASHAVISSASNVIEVEFYRVAGDYELFLADETTRAETTVKLKCKYVRREIRALGDDERAKLFGAMSEVHRLGHAEGRAKYGKKTGPRTASFFTDAYFGSYATADHVISGGPFAFAPVAAEGALGVYDWPETNAYGKLTERWNGAADKYVARARTVCGLETKARLPGCANLRDVLKSANDTRPFGLLSGFHSAVENEFHSVLHGAIGGAWDCTMTDGTSLDLGAFLNDDVGCDFGDCAYNVRCPAKDSCVEGGDCRCKSDAFDAAYDKVRGDALAEERLAHEVLNKNRIYSEIFHAQDKVILWANTSDADRGGFHHDVFFLDGDGAPLDAAANSELKVLLVKLLMNPASVGPFTTPLAAPNDPLFWSSHSNWERLWHYVQLDGAYAMPAGAAKLEGLWDYVHAVPQLRNGTCWGVYWASKLPFSSFTNHSDFTDYTNGELVQLFDPRNDELPFVYDDMATMLDHCPDAPKKTDVKLI